MGVFANIMEMFKPKVRIYYGAGGRASPWNREIYEQETVRAIIDCIASNAAKAVAMHVTVDKQDRIKEIHRNSPYAKLLNQKPNGIMSGFDLKYKLVASLQEKNTAMAFIKWDGTTPKAIIPIQYSFFEFFGIQGGGYAVQFTDETDGKQYTLNVEDVVILRRHYNHHPVAGDSNSPITNTLSMVKASDEGLIEALNVANKVRGLLKQKKSMLAPEDVEKSTAEFAERFQKAAKEGGILGVDAMEDFTPLNVTPWSANAAQMKEVRENLFYYWRINPAIEPLLTQMAQAFTNACFTQRERDVGNKIIFNSSTLIYASMAEKVQLVSTTREIGMMTPNEQRELFGLPPVEGGDERVLSLNYIKQSDMSKYQTGEDPDDNTPTDPDDGDPGKGGDKNGETAE